MSKIVIHALLTAGLAMAVAGCSGGPRKIAGAGAKLPDAESEPAFLDRVSSQKTVSENEAMRGILFLINGNDQAQTFEHRVAALRQKKIVDPSWDFAASRAMTKGKLAYMVYQACNMDGGVILTLGGPSQRYCLRELQYRSMMSPGLPGTDVTGMEFVAVLGRAGTYRQTGKFPE